MEVFLAVAREGGFSRAADKLYRTQSAVSQAIRKLETEIGEPLFGSLSARRAATRRRTRRVPGLGLWRLVLAIPQHPVLAIRVIRASRCPRSV